ncbi:MAG: DM13 domain-containing protein [Chloroflexi bacterium]|nr:DM13 domain-containing protein [Chloroflexota bacterium]
MASLKHFIVSPLGKTVAIALGVLAIPAVALAWWLASPLFISEEVSEQFPMAYQAQAPPGMTLAEVESILAGMAKVDSPMTETVEEGMALAVRLKSGVLRDADSFHKGRGQAVIYGLPSGERLLRLEDIRITNGPDLHVLLSAHPDPRNPAEVKDTGFLDMGKLKGNIGSQNYPVPAGTDLSLYRSVVIYCWPFNVVFSVAPLQDEQL